MEIGWGRSVPRECVMITSYHTPRSVSFSLRHLETPPRHGGQGPVQLRDFPPLQPSPFPPPLQLADTHVLPEFWQLLRVRQPGCSHQNHQKCETLVPMLFLHTLGFPFQAEGSHFQNQNENQE